MIKCGSEGKPKKRLGRQKKGPDSSHQNGWFMLTNPRTGLILEVKPIREPEIN